MGVVTLPKSTKFPSLELQCTSQFQEIIHNAQASFKLVNLVHFQDVQDSQVLYTLETLGNELLFGCDTYCLSSAC